MPSTNKSHSCSTKIIIYRHVSKLHTTLIKLNNSNSKSINGHQKMQTFRNTTSTSNLKIIHDRINPNFILNSAKKICTLTFDPSKYIISRFMLYVSKRVDLRFLVVVIPNSSKQLKDYPWYDYIYIYLKMYLR